MPHTPLYNTTTFAYPSSADLLAVVEGRQPGNLYTRYGSNPSLRSLEAKLASLEEAETALVFTAGMAAESSLFLAHGGRGVLCLGEVYGGTHELLVERLPLLGVQTRILLRDELDGLDAALAAGVGLVFLETPSNPTLELFDIAAIAARVHAHGALLAVDNTFATPVNQRPLALGADLVCHSATKYLGGHSDITAGVVMGCSGLLAPVDAWRRCLGQTPAPETAALLARSLRTLAVRVERHNANALAVARALERHPRVTRVCHPGLPDAPGHDLARRQMDGYGGMVSFEVAGGMAAAAAVVDRLRLFTLAPSLGGVESLVTQPATTSHHGLTAAERARRGIGEGLIRLSVGLEDAADLIADLEQALD